MLQIKNQALVVSQTIKSRLTELVIIRDNPTSHQGATKLSEVFEFTPYGLIYKEETGMGVTTLELLAPRHSIIVEPIKITASSKAYKVSQERGEKVLYVGSETAYHTNKISNTEIVDYINDTNIQFKKIIVVADSLFRVFEAGGEFIFKNYFLFIDEADSFQMDSLFRRSMENCLDIYKQFDADKRCMVSATLLDFTDPDLEKEQKTIIKYDESTVRNIHIIQSDTNSLNGNVSDKIEDLLKRFPADKIMVAYNSVTNCYSIAEDILNKKLCTKKEIKILCSKNSKDKVVEYFEELNSDQLPGKLNFVTSAYFSGFDLNEKYHLISVSGNKNEVYALSDKKLKQIAGRCRVGLLSETIIHDLANEPNKIELIQKETLLEIAKDEISALNCIQKHFSKNTHLKEIQNEISNAILDTLNSKKKRYVYKKADTGEFKISYLNIDAQLEQNKTAFELYRNYDALGKRLENDGHKITSIYNNSLTNVEIIDINSQDRLVKIKTLIDTLEQTNEVEYEFLLMNKDFDNYQKKIIKKFIRVSPFIDKSDLIKHLKDRCDSRDSRSLDNFFNAAFFAILPDSHLYKRNMKFHFPLGQEFSKEEIIKKIELVILESNLKISINKDRTAIKFFKLHFHAISNRKNGKLKIKRENPLNLKIKKLIPYEEEITNPSMNSQNNISNSFSEESFIIDESNLIDFVPIFDL
jgi:hypothetical protein